MSPAPNPKHQLIANTLGALFYFGLKNCKQYKAYQAIDFKISEHTILQPDALIVCKNIQKPFLDFPPSLVVEILSPSTAVKDRHTKYALYEEQRIPYYIIISPDTEETEVYILDNQKYVLKQKGKSFIYKFQFTADCFAAIDFNNIWE